MTAPPDMALCRVAEAPEGIPIPPGRYEWFDTEWEGVFIACPIAWKNHQRPLIIVDLPGKRALAEVFEPHFDVHMARQAATLAVTLVELGRKDPPNAPAYLRLYP